MRIVWASAAAAARRCARIYCLHHWKPGLLGRDFLLSCPAAKSRGKYESAETADFL